MTPDSPNLPWHSIPQGTSTCEVHLIQAGGIYIPYDMTLLPGPDEPNSSTQQQSNSDSGKDPSTFYAPIYVFLIKHPASNKAYIFDLGIRTDLDSLPPYLKKNVLPTFKCEPLSPAELLKQHGSADQQPSVVEAVIFSHMHFDHVGDGGKQGFEQAELWVGPTTCTYARPGYPVDEGAPTLSETLPADGTRKIVESYVSDEMLREAGDKRAGCVAKGKAEGKYTAVELKEPSWTPLGAFDRAYDVFGDGAAYLVDAPGHSAGHQMMLVRTTTSRSQDTFVLLAGDCYHHPELLKDPRRTARPPYSKEGMHGEPEQAIDTIWRTREFAKRENIWVMGAHDFTVGESIAPGTKLVEGLVSVNKWFEKGWKNPLEI